MCVGVGVNVCVMVDIHVGVLWWAFMYVCVMVGVHVCVLGWAFMYVC